MLASAKQHSTMSAEWCAVSLRSALVKSTRRYEFLLLPSTAPRAERRRSADRKVVSQIVVPQSLQSWHRAASNRQSSILQSINRNNSTSPTEKSRPRQQAAP